MAVFIGSSGWSYDHQAGVFHPKSASSLERLDAYARLFRSDTERCDAFTTWLHTYNHHRGHTALGGQPPASRVPNLSGQYS